MRKVYIDNVRWVTVLLVMLYHIFYMFNSVGVPGGVGSFSDIQYQDAFMYFVYPWFMVLLFVIAGMSAKYALDKRCEKEFIKSRTVKLLVPSTLGLFAFQFTVGYYNIKIGGGLEQIPKFLLYPISAVSGTGHLWFIQLLWLFSLLIVLLRKIDKEEKCITLCKRCNIMMVILLFVPIWAGSQILNMPVFTCYRFGIYFVSFLIGYFVLSNDEIQDKIEKVHIPLLITAVIMGAAYTYIFFGEDYTSPEILKNIFTGIYLWIMILAVLGTAKAHFNRENKFTGYMTRSSYGFYIVHYVVTLIPCYYLKQSGLPALVVYILAIAIVFGLTPILYEIIRRIPGYRWVVLGMEGKNNAER